MSRRSLPSIPEARVPNSRCSTRPSTPHLPTSLSYIGTADGLASLIADIHAADVADGVTLVPLALPKVLERVVDGTLPWLERRGLVTASETADEALAKFGLHRPARAS